MQQTNIATNKLKTSPNNPRAIRENKMEKLMLSIAEDPELMEARPLIVNDRMEVLAGNQRLRACIALGWAEVPCIVVDWDEAKQKRAMIKDNVSAGEWDWDLLANEWDAEELNDWGLEVPLEEEPVEGLTDADDVPEVPEEPTTKPGDLWILGEHRLLCGDSTKAEDVERLMDGKKADMVFTDPPYAIYGSSTGVGDDIADTKMIEPFFRQIFHSMATSLSGHFYVCCDWRTYPILNDLLHGAGFAVKNMVVWDKVRMGMGMFYRNTHELIICGYPRFNKVKMRGKKTFGKVSDSNVWSIDRETKKEHGAQKPVELANRAIKNSSLEGELVLDLFGGSGSTMLAAEGMNRTCYMMEMEPKYCDVIVKRWEDFTGKKAELWKQ